MIDGLNYYTQETIRNVYLRPLDVIGLHDPFESYCFYVHVPYDDFRVSSTAVAGEREGVRVGIFLVRVDLSDCRHVTFAFHDEKTRDDFLSRPGVVTRRSDLPIEIRYS